MIQSFDIKRSRQDRRDSHSGSVNLEVDEWLRMRRRCWAMEGRSQSATRKTLTFMNQDEKVTYNILQ